LKKTQEDRCKSCAILVVTNIAMLSHCATSVENEDKKRDFSKT